MRLLVTGGAGFLGSNFIRYWLRKYPKDKITNLDKLTYAGHLSSLKEIEKDKRYKFVKGDILNKKLVDSLMSATDMVIHFAAESHVDRSIIGPSVFAKTNVLGTQVLLDSALKHKVKRFHHVSTDEVFGSLKLDSRSKFDENTPYRPKSPYSASKAGSDHLVMSYFETYGMNVTITNCSNNFGPFQDTEKLIPRFITNLIDAKPLPLYGDGRNVRDWLYVEDHCIAIDLVTQKAKPGSVYLVGGMTKDVNNLSVAKAICKYFGFGTNMIKKVPDRKGHDRRYSVNWSKIKKDLGWRPTHSFDQALHDTIEWYVANERWWRPLKRRSETIYKKTGQS